MLFGELHANEMFPGSEFDRCCVRSFFGFRKVYLVSERVASSSEDV